MNASTATPDQITNYKQSWLPKGHSVIVNQGFDVEGKDWCRHNLERWAWSMEAFTTPEKHTFLFEQKQNAEDFESIVK